MIKKTRETAIKTLEFDPHDLACEELRHVYRNKNSSKLIVLFSGLVAAGMLAWDIGIIYAGTWYAWLLVAHAWHWWLGRLDFLSANVSIELARINRHVTAAAIAGLGWGALSFSLPFVSRPSKAAILIIMLIGVIMALPRLVVFLPIFFAFAAGVYVPLLLATPFLDFETLHMAMVMLIAVGATMWASASEVRKILIDVLLKQVLSEQASWEDKLTGIGNRRSFDVNFANYWAQACRSKVPLSLMMVDVDFFKKFNDSYGHQAGDECLRQVALALDGCARRAGDSVTRYGGEDNGFDGQLSATPNQVLLGKLNTVQGIRQFTADGSRGAVYVKATKVVPSSMVAGGLFGGTVSLHAEAVSASDPSLATFGVGSFTTNLSSQQSVLLNGLLGGMLGGPLSLDALTYRGIAATTVTLQDILAVSGQSGTVEGLLNTNMQIGDLLDLVASAAARNSLADIQAISAMQNIANMTIKPATLKLGDVLAVTTPDANAAATVALNALSVITTAAMVANGVNAITLPLGINIPSITSINAQVTVTEAPKLAIGPAAEGGGICTSARTAQIRTRVAVLVNIPLLARIDLALGMEVAQGSASLRSIRHNEGDTEVEIEASPGIAALTLRNSAGTGPARISTLSGLLALADIGLNIPLQPPNAQTVEFTVAHPTKSHLPLMQSMASPLGSSLQNALGRSNALTITVLSVLNLGLINNVISSIVSPLLAEIGRVLLDPLLSLLGISLGGMDITLSDVQYRQAKPLVM